MPTLTEVAGAHTDLTEDDLAWLSLLMADWQIVADLSFADLVLWLPDSEGKGLWAGGQMRPTTGPTAYVDDVVGSFVPTGRRPLLDAALTSRRVLREGDPELRDEVPVRVEAIPVVHAGRSIGVIARSTNLLGVRTPSRLELAYLTTAAELTGMIGAGLFPFAGQRSDHTDSPRVGDGFLRLNEQGVVTYASPNALSAFRRLGLSTDLDGLDLARTTRDLLAADRRPDEETLSAVLGGRRPRDTELSNGSTVLIVRSLPLLTPQGDLSGGFVLVRDVSDLRSRDRELVTKDATIREIHHRVKNNLQTVAALLRLQARRMQVPEARAALETAVRRVGSIALVHETLSHSLEETVAFDEIADRLRCAMADLASESGEITTSREGTFGAIPGEIATALAMVLTELLQNAADHAFGSAGGQVRLVVHRREDDLEVHVIDDGTGLPTGFDAADGSSLGLSIVRTLVESELGGAFSLSRPGGGGADAMVRLGLTGP